MSGLKSYMTSPVGLSKIATIVVGIGAFITVHSAGSNSSWAGTSKFVPYGSESNRGCGGGCPLSRRGCPEPNDAAVPYFIVLFGVLGSCAGALALVIAFDKIANFAHFPKIDLAGHVIAILVEVVAAYKCFKWAEQSYSKMPCGDKDEGCEKDRDEVLNPSTFNIAGAVVVICAAAYLATAVFIAKGMMAASGAGGAATTAA